MGINLRWTTLLGVVVAAVMVGAFAGTAAGIELTRLVETSRATTSTNNMNAVVDINTVVSTANGNGSAAGTGLILNSHGEVLTNNHVVAGATSITVNLVGGTVVYNASVVGVDPTDDIAVIQVSGVKNWPSASFADTTSLSVGAKVSAVGNALGLGGPPRVSTGKITAVGQSITAGGLFDGTETLSNMIEFDATVSPGESGGPLLDSNGKVVGMITAASGGNGNLPSAPAYAIPSNTALSIVRQVEAGHASSTIILGQVGYIGVVVSELDAASATQVNLSVGQGVLVISVNADSPAQKAGLTAGSVIEAVGNQKVSTRVELGTAIHAYKPGDSLSVTWADKQGTHTASLVLIGGPAI